MPAIGILGGVVTFGEALRILRDEKKKQTGPAMAMRALGPNSTEVQRRTYTNYLSRIENDGVKSIGLDWLHKISKGLGFSSLTPFFGALDAIEAEAGGSGDATSSLEKEHEDGSRLADILVSHDRASFSPSASEADLALLSRLAAALVNVVDTAANALPESRRQAPTARRRSPQRAKSARSHRR